MPASSSWKDQGEPQSGYWLASQILELKLWRASEADVRDALDKDIAARVEASLLDDGEIKTEIPRHGPLADRLGERLG